MFVRVLEIERVLLYSIHEGKCSLGWDTKFAGEAPASNGKAYLVFLST